MTENLGALYEQRFPSFIEGACVDISCSLRYAVGMSHI